MSLEKWQNSKFIVCHNCAGRGKINDKDCPVCKTYGAGLAHKGKFFYWKKEINGTYLALEKFNRVLNRAFLSIVSILAFLGLGFFAWNYYSYYVLPGNSGDILTFYFWNRAAWPLTALYISGLLICFLYYRWRLHKNRLLNLQEDLSDLEENALLSNWQSIEQAIADKSKLVDLSKYLSVESEKALGKAWSLANSLKMPEITPLHLLGALTESRDISLLLVRLGIDLGSFNKKTAKALLLLRDSYQNKTIQTKDLLFNVNLKKVLLYAGLDAWESQFKDIADVNLFLALGTTDYFINQYNLVNDILEEFKVDDQKLVNIVEWGKIKRRILSNNEIFRKLARLKPQTNMNRAMTSLATPLLDRFSKDYTRLAINGRLMPCLNRDKEIKDILQKIESSQQSVLLLGNDGVGKTSVIEGIAQLMVMEKVPAQLQDKRLIYLDVPGILSSFPPTEIPQAFQQVLQEIVRAGNIVLLFEDIENLITNMQVGGVNLLDVLLQYLENRTIYAFATVSPANYAEYVEKTKLSQVLGIVKIQEFENDAAIQVIEGRSNYIEGKHGVFLTYDAIAAAVELSGRYIYDKYLPAKAFQVLEEVALDVRQLRGEGAVVLREDVARELSEQSGIPLTQLAQNETEKLLNLESEIHKRVIGQEEAVKMVATSLRRARAELRSTKRPIANLLFLGPTGVGKTELAKAVAEVYFGGEDRMIRFDMSEYQDKASISRLIGANNEAGLLTEAVRKQPFALLLFDELEKANPDILNIFLQILDDGRLTDGTGRTVDFTNTIIIATSNAGAQYIQESIAAELDIEEIKRHLLEQELQKYYRPEFINRFDGVMVFKPLTYENIMAITRLMLKGTQKNMEAKQIYLQFTDEAVKEIATLGYDPQFGARPLRRAIQEHVEDILANYLLSAKIGARDQVVFDRGGEIKVEKVSHL